VETYEQEQQHDEQYWRGQMRERRRLVVERHGQVLGVATVTRLVDEPGAADVSGLWVAPEVRHTGAASRLVELAAELAAEDGCSKLYYWVGSENGRAIGFALNAGFRGTSRRRTAATEDPEFGDQEVALVLNLSGDPTVIPNSSSRSLLQTS